MLNITKEELSKLYRAQKISLKLLPAVSVVSFVLYFIFIRIISRYIERDTYLKVLLVFLAVDVLMLIAAALMKKKFIPKDNSYESVKNSVKVINTELNSPNTINTLCGYISCAHAYDERCKLISLLACIYASAGYYAEAINALKTVDISRFNEFPRSGMSFYADLIEFYWDMGDYDSVLAAYADGEQFISECCHKNYINCGMAVAVLAYVHSAKGDNARALDYYMMRFLCEEDFVKSFSAGSNTPLLSRYVMGDRYFRTARFYYLNGDYANAAKYLDGGRELYYTAPALLNGAERLSEELKAKIG